MSSSLKPLKLEDKVYDVVAALNRRVVPILTMAVGVLTVIIPAIGDWSSETGIAVGSAVAVLGIAKITLNYIVRCAQAFPYEEDAGDGGADEQDA